ncbi:MAG: glycosyltransferase family 9 protein [Candidatus Aminicenantes bacterium]|nr:glycosyltransferase family 9 protein [Candidatus Aminicenantes bacterium]
MSDRFLIVRTSSLGDIIHALPALAALRKHKPEAEIRWIIGDKGRAILDWVEGLDGIVMTGSPGWRRSIRGRDQTSLDFQGLLKSGLIGFLSGAKRRIGFHRDNLREPAVRIFYTEHAAPYPETEHVIRKNIHLLTVLGITETDIAFPLRVPDPARKAAHETLRGLGWDGRARIVVFNVGAAWPTKRWFPERWRETIAGIARPDRFPVLLWGSPDEKALAEEVAGAEHPRPTAIVPFLTIQESMALIASARLLVSGDTFALQAAAALDVPIVGLFGPTDPRRNGPFRERDKVIHPELACNRCYKRACDTIECLKAITAGEVAARIEEALAEHA